MYFCDILKHSDSNTPMSSASNVNPYLQTLMSLVDDLQDQMPEGKYLEAMNALRDLHSGKKPPPPPFVVPAGNVRLTDAEHNEWSAMEHRRTRHSQQIPAVLLEYRRIPALREACRWEGDTVLSEEQWVTYTGNRDPYIKRALILMAEEKIKEYNRHKNPKAIHCPFMARNADGKWYKPNLALVDANGYDRCRWDCLCGSKNILCKNWRQHEVSDKHQAWERGGRQVSVHKVRKMRFILRDESYLVEILGQEITWKQNHESHKPQSRNEWTNPEIFTGKPKDWVPPELPDPVMAYRRGNRTETSATMPRTLPPLPRILLSGSPEWVFHMPEEDYARFLSMTE
jgi:hypothetical protein